MIHPEIESAELTGYGIGQSPNLVGDCQACGVEMYGYEVVQCPFCDAEVHRSCLITCEECGLSGCKRCINKRDVGGRDVCDE